MTSAKSPRPIVRITAALVVIMACLGLVAATEIALRFAGLGDPVLYYETNAPYRFALRPEQSSVRLRGAQVAIDRYGLRTADDWGREGAVIRILFIGDSVTYGGSYIDNSELLSSLVCEQLRSQYTLTALCGNAGVNAYGTDNMSGRILFYEGPEVDAMVVTVLSRDTVRGQTQLREAPFFSTPPPEPDPAIVEAAVFVLDRVRGNIRFERDKGHRTVGKGNRRSAAP